MQNPFKALKNAYQELKQANVRLIVLEQLLAAQKAKSRRLQKEVERLRYINCNLIAKNMICSNPKAADLIKKLERENINLTNYIKNYECK